MGVHVNFGAISMRIMVRSQRDDVISLQVEHPTSVQTTCPLTTCWWLHHRDSFVVNLNKDSYTVVVVNLSVDVVPSWGRNFQFSVLVRHTTCKIAVRSTDRPILDHYETNYEHISVKLWKVWTQESFQSVCNVTTQLIYKVIPLTINPPS